jgi:hypothetical protein
MTKTDKVTAEDWYPVEEIRRWLKGIKPELEQHAEFFTCHLRHAFRKGQQLSPEAAALRAENERLRDHLHKMELEHWTTDVPPRLKTVD